METQDPKNPIGLFRGIDGDKDQAYVLAGIDRRYLKRMLLPVGQYHKPEIRSRAADIGLRVADKKDSQEICFVTSGKHGEFVRERTSGSTAGEIVTTSGRVVGRHPGIEQFTIGQRKGLGVAMGEPYFIVKIEPETHRVIIGRQHELARHRLQATGANWLVDDESLREILAQRNDIFVQIRYNSAPQPADVAIEQDGSLSVEFHDPSFGVAPGQLAVVFHGDRVLGGSWIERTE